MGKIRVLSELVANKIAAGEVVERPASVVKELVENSLDAGARSISVQVRHGGKSLIQVRDDGLGMDAADARTCLQRHATSKIADVEDIENIETMGFRGEALPSIASISRLTLTTRRAEDATAVLIKAAGGELLSAGECVADTGTSVEVADLFFNTPARKKFLKSDAAENNAVADVFNNLALSRRDVSLRLSRNDTVAADYPARKQLRDRIEQIFDPEFARQLYPISLDKPEFRLSGYISAPDYTRVNRTGQRFFINRRPVTSPSLSSALARAYDEFTAPRRFPAAVLFLEIDHTFVDVNVHPAKREVRIRNERFFQDMVVRAVRDVLNRRGFHFERPPAAASALPPARGGYAAGAPIRFERLKESAAGWPPPARACRDAEPFPPEALPASSHRQGSLPATACVPGPFGVTRVLGQLHGTYILAEAEEGLMVYDQHAAHERILYEQLLEAVVKNRSHSQKILFPLTLHLDLQEAPVLEECMEDLQKMGFGINPLGSGTFSVDAMPVCLADGNAEAALRDTLHEIMEKAFSRTFDSRREALAALLACKSHAVKAGRALDLREMEHLIEALAACRNPHTCPHGRPTFFLTTTDELEKKFKRK